MGNPFSLESSVERREDRFKASSAMRSKYWKEKLSAERDLELTQDAKLEVPENGTFMVADGVGGEEGGALASKEVATFMRNESAAFKGMSAEQLVKALPERIALAHARILERGQEEMERKQDKGYRQMATTCCLVQFAESEKGGMQVVVANVGDSRAYLLRKGEKIRPLANEEDSFLGYGRAQPEKIEIQTADVQEGDKVFMTTDGILKNLSEEALQLVIQCKGMSGREIVGLIKEFQVTPDQEKELFELVRYVKGQNEDITQLLTDPMFQLRVQRTFHAIGRNVPAMDAPNVPNKQPSLAISDDMTAIMIEVTPKVFQGAAREQAQQPKTQETPKTLVPEQTTAKPAITPEQKKQAREVLQQSVAEFKESPLVVKAALQLEKMREPSPENIQKEIGLRKAFEGLSSDHPVAKELADFAQKDPRRAARIAFALFAKVRTEPTSHDLVPLRTILTPVLKDIQKVLG